MKTTLMLWRENQGALHQCVPIPPPPPFNSLGEMFIMIINV